MAGKILQAAVVGGSTLLGKELVDEISNSPAAAWDLKLLEEGAESEGRLTSAGDEALVMHTLDDAAFVGVDLVLFAGSAETTKQYLQPALKAGAAVVDLTGATADQSGFLLRSPWLDSTARPDLMTTGVIVPHAAALMLAVVLGRLQKHFGKVEAVATVLEPASQAGSAGVDELHQQTVSLLSFQELPKAVFGTQVAFNVQSAFGEESGLNLQATRDLIEGEVRQVLSADFQGTVSLNLLQVPVFHGYVASLHTVFATEMTAQGIGAAIQGDPVNVAGDVLPSNQSAVESSELLVSIHADKDHPTSAWLTLAADNLRLRARSAVQSAMELVALRPGSRVQ